MSQKQRNLLGPIGVCLSLALPGLAAAQPRAGDGPEVRTTDHAIEAYISEDALQAQYIRTIEVGQSGPLDVKGGFFYNEDRDLIMNADILAPIGNPTSRRPIEVRVGARAYGAFIAVEDQDVFGVGLGGEAEYFFGRGRETSVKLSLYYSPDIATFGNSDDILDGTLRLQTRLGNGTDVFVGFRVFEIDLDIADREVDDNMHIGVRRSF